MEREADWSVAADALSERQVDGHMPALNRDLMRYRMPPRAEFRARNARRTTGTLVAVIGLLLVAAPALLALLLGLDSSSDTCEDAFGGPCDGAPQYFAATVGLLAAPVLLGLAVARPRRVRAWVVATVGVALMLFVALLLAT
ncbi:hypothetical protein [Cellulosimicrobium sp. Marseille-Q8652]